MKTITITEAKRSLGYYLKQAAAGEDIAIVSGADIISHRKIELVPIDRVAGKPTGGQNTAASPEFPTFAGGPADAAAYHDKYLYDQPRPKRRKSSAR